MKQCSSCKLEKGLDYFGPYARNRDGLQSQCKVCRKEYRKAHPDAVRRYNRKHQRKLRMEVIAAYGGGCACCGESTYEFMALDHINNGKGNPANRDGGSVTLWYRLKRDGWPKGEYQILCHNCNLAKGFYGQCPHQIQSDVIP